MKIINFVIVLMILVCGSQLSHEEELNCVFRDEGYYGVGSLYSCAVTSLDNPHNNLTIDAYSGEHKANKNDADVKGIRIFNTNSKYIPTNLGSLFNLIALHMERIQLVEIKAKDFHGMQDLESITFYENKLKSVPLDAFATLTKLRFIDLGSNQIEELPNGIFAKNLKIQRIQLYGNKIKYLGTEIFHDLNKLHFVYLGKNICVNKEYRGTTEINQLKDDIKMKCKNPNEVQATTSTTKTPTTNSSTTSTTQNPMEVKLIEMQEENRKLEKDLKESKELQQKNEAKATKASNGEKLNCEFRNVVYDIVGLFYSCAVTSLDNPHNNLTIEGYSGEHKATKNDADVKGILIQDTNTKYIPTNLGSFSNLTALRLRNIQLVEIKAIDFHGMQNLESISFVHNKLSSVPLDVFTTLTKLIIIDLSSNQIEELPNGIFKNNLELEEIHLYGNKIKYLGTEIFHDLKKLNFVTLIRNICVNKYYRGKTEINQMKEDIKMNCDVSNYAIYFKLTGILNAIDVEKKDRVEIEKLRTALVEAKDREQVKVLEVSNLNQDLLECKQMNERIPKLERETYEQRRMERSALIEVKGKLNRAEEQLAQCLKDNPGM